MEIELEITRAALVAAEAKYMEEVTASRAEAND